MSYLQEHLTFDQAKIVTESTNGGKELYLSGIMVQGDVRNANQRVYPGTEIRRAVGSLNEQIKRGNSILGEIDHPSDLKINLDRVSHMITEMWLDGANGYGKMKILPTPMGNLAKTMLENGVKLGVSSRGSGNVNESDGSVSDFEIVTVDIVATPSAPDAFPKAIYESIMNQTHGHKIFDMSNGLKEDPSIQRYLKKELIKYIDQLKWR